MKLILIALFLVALLLLLLFACFLFLIAPKKVTPALRDAFYHCRFAHRGLHTKDKSVPENSLAAFRLAVEAGYGIELDIRLTKDQKLVVFHDDTLLRMCGVNKRVDAFTYEELFAFTLLDTTEQIPLFSEVLSLVAGRIPLLVELKTGPQNALLCEHALALLSDYQGTYCIESFHPMIVRWFRKHAPEVLRGQLSAQTKEFAGELSKPSALLLSRLLTNVLSRPHFIAYHKGKAPFSLRLCKKLGALRAVWTLRDSDFSEVTLVSNQPDAWFGDNDMIIFEFLRPGQ